MGYFIWCILFLVICTYTDLRERYVYRQVCIVNLVAVVLIKLLDSTADAKELAIGILIGVIVYVISVLTKEQVGKGDAWVIANIGGLLGAPFVVTVIAWALAIGSLFGMSKVAAQKSNLKSKIAFVPFMLLGTVITYMVR